MKMKMKSCRPLFFMAFLYLALGCEERKPSTVLFDQGTQDQALATDLKQTPDALSCDHVGPVKVLLVVDNSGSIKFTDPDNSRQAQVLALFDHFKQNPAVSFGLMTFATTSTLDSFPDVQMVFTTDHAQLAAAAGHLTTPYAGRSDYSGVLEKASAILQYDMSVTPASIRSATRYVVILLTDGRPSPICQEGCNNDLTSSNAGECEAEKCDTPPWTASNGLICDTPRASWCDALGLTKSNCSSVENSFNPIRSSCRAYNTDEDILWQVDRLMGLRTTFTLGGLQLHTVRVLANLDPSTRELLDLDLDLGASLLTKMAAAGEGLFFDQTPGDLDLTTLDLASTRCMPAELPLPNKECALTSGGGGIPTCQESADCLLTLSRSICHPTEKICVECLSNSDCTSQGNKKICHQGTDTFTLGICVQCQGDQDCLAGPGSTNKCVPVGYSSSLTCAGCETDQDCKSAGIGMICNEQIKICQECAANWHCSAGPGKTNFCSNPSCTGCWTNEDCQNAGLGQACELDLNFSYIIGRCVDCLADDQCVKGPANTGRCADTTCDGCIDHQECNDAFGAENGIPDCS